MYFYVLLWYFCGTFSFDPHPKMSSLSTQQFVSIGGEIQGAVGITAVMSCALFGGLANWHLIHLSVCGTPNFSLVTQLCGGCPRIFSITAGIKFDLTAKHHKSCGNAMSQIKMGIFEYYLNSVFLIITCFL